MTQANLAKLSAAMTLLRAWARDRGLVPSETAYVARTRDRRNLQFSKSGNPDIERSYRTHWVSPALSEAKRRRLAERQGRPTDLVVVRFSRSRKRYERQGILVEEAALEQAERECLADEDARARRREREEDRRAERDVAFQVEMAAEISRLFPGCPTGRADAIARQAGARGSGRVGRSAAGRALDARAVTLAVVASVRHEDTCYDELLMSGVPRGTARERVQGEVQRTLASWQAPEQR